MRSVPRTVVVVPLILPVRPAPGPGGRIARVSPAQAGAWPLRARPAPPASDRLPRPRAAGQCRSGGRGARRGALGGRVISVQDLVLGVRLLRRPPPLLRHPLTAGEAQAILSRRLDRRQAATGSSTPGRPCASSTASPSCCSGSCPGRRHLHVLAAQERLGRVLRRECVTVAADAEPLEAARNGPPSQRWPGHRCKDPTRVGRQPDVRSVGLPIVADPDGVAHSVVWNSILRASVTRREASRISSETRFPWSS